MTDVASVKVRHCSPHGGGGGGGCNRATLTYTRGAELVKDIRQTRQTANAPRNARVVCKLSHEGLHSSAFLRAVAKPVLRERRSSNEAVGSGCNIDRPSSPLQRNRCTSTLHRSHGQPTIVPSAMSTATTAAPSSPGSNASSTVTPPWLDGSGPDNSVFFKFSSAKSRNVDGISDLVEHTSCGHDDVACRSSAGRTLSVSRSRDVRVATQVAQQRAASPCVRRIRKTTCSAMTQIPQPSRARRASGPALLSDAKMASSCAVMYEKSRSTGVTRGNPVQQSKMPAQLLVCPKKGLDDCGSTALLTVLQDGERLVRSVRSSFRMHDTDGDGLLSFVQVERLILALHKRLRLQPSGGDRTHEDVGHVSLQRLRRSDADGDGKLQEKEVLELYRWTLWRRYEDLNQATIDRAKFVGTLHDKSLATFYTTGKSIGSGNFGTIRNVLDRASESSRVVKTLRRQADNDLETNSGRPRSTGEEEISFLAMLDHPHILRIYESFYENDRVHIVTDFCRGGDLFGILRENAALEKTCSEPFVARIFLQVLQAVAHCHDRGVIHKDLKFENIMLRNRLTSTRVLDDVHIVVIDMGLSELFGEQHGRGIRSSTACGTLTTMAPEVIAHDFSCKCDVWSVGCLVFAMLNSQPRRLNDCHGCVALDHFPFAVTATDDDPLGINGLMDSHAHGPDYLRLDGVSEEGVSAVKAMLSYDEDDRPGALDCLSLPWFQQGNERPSRHLSQVQVRTLLDRSKRELRAWWVALIAKAASMLSASDVALFEDQFKAMDSSGNGYISRSDFVLALHQFRVPRQDSERVADAVNSSGTGRISWSEFIAALLPSSEDLLCQGVAAVFARLDLDMDGEVRTGELVEALCKGDFGEAAANACLQKPLVAKSMAEMMIKEMDQNCDGSLNLHDLKGYLLGRDAGNGTGNNRCVAETSTKATSSTPAKGSMIRGKSPLSPQMVQSRRRISV